MTSNQTVQDTTTRPVEKSKTFNSFVSMLMLLGIFCILAGTIHVFSMVSSGFTNIRLADALFNTSFGIIAIISSRVLAKGKRLVIMLVSGGVLFSIVYGFAIGRGFNFIIAALGLWFIWQLVLLKRHGELV